MQLLFLITKYCILKLLFKCNLNKKKPVYIDEKDKGGVAVEDSRIIELYFERSENAVSETQSKYGNYCYSIAYNILHSNEDSEECVNDTYVKVWNAIPPTRPNNFSAFIGSITRNTALNIYLKGRTQKRSAQTESLFDEINDCVSSDSSIPDELALKDAINGFLASLPKKTRIVFMRRYWYCDSVADIAKLCNISENNVKVILTRTRKKFKEYLGKEGIYL